MRICHECIKSSVSTVPPVVNSSVTVYACKTCMFMGRVAALVLHAHCWVGMALSPEMPIRHQFYQLHSKQI